MKEKSDSWNYRSVVFLIWFLGLHPFFGSISHFETLWGNAEKSWNGIRLSHLACCFSSAHSPFVEQVLVMSRWRHLHFYASEKSADGWTRFVSTASFEKSIELTDDGRDVAKQADVSGLFPNRFRNFSNAVLNVGIVPVSSHWEFFSFCFFITFFLVVVEIPVRR